VKLSVAPSLIAALSILAGCGGGGGGSPTAPSSRTILYVSAQNAGANTVTLRQVPGALRDEVGPQRVLSLEVVVTQVSNLHTLAFELGFPGDLFTGDRVVLGPHLTRGGTTVDQSGIVGGNFFRLRLEREALNGVSGSGVVATLDLLPLSASSGSGDLFFTNAEALRPDGSTKPNVTFIAGTVDVSQQ